MERTHIRAHILLLLAGLVLLLNGCAPSSQVPPSALPSPSAAVSEKAERPTPPPPTAQPSEAEPEEPTEPVVIVEPEDIQEVLYAAISEIRQPPAMDISQVSFSQTPEIDVKNLYYGLTKQYPELKYAYDVSPVACCQGLFHHVYKTFTTFCQKWPGTCYGSRPAWVITRFPSPDGLPHGAGA